MKRIQLGQSDILAPEIIYGCMRLTNLSQKQATAMIKTAIECGINFFDHADIYGKGECERMFAIAAADLQIKRSTLILQSKCGIRKGFYDCSYEHIITSVRGILERLNTDYLDVLLLHRPDALIEPEEVAKAFFKLKEEKLVKSFGVSNFSPAQIELLKSATGEESICANQLQFSPAASQMVDFGLHVNTKNDLALDRDGSVLDYCRLNKITIQAWSPFHAFNKGVYLDNKEFSELNRMLKRVGAQYGATPTATATAWILRHPAKMQVIAGTTNPERLKEICMSEYVNLTREQWYEIYKAAGNKIP